MKARSTDADFYQRLRQRIERWLVTRGGATHRGAELVLLAPDLFHLLCRLAAESAVPLALRAQLAAAIAYFVFALDVIPEALLGPAGYVDDVALAALVLHAVVNGASPAIVRRHWAGHGDVLQVIQRVLSMAEGLIGRGMWQRVARVVGMRPAG